MNTHPANWKRPWQLAAVVCVLVTLGGCVDDDGLNVPIKSDVGDTSDMADGEDVDEDLPEFCQSPPVADAGPAGEVVNEDTFDLEGDADDPDTTDSLTILWSQTSGPVVDISDETSLTTSVSVDVDPEDIGEILSFELEVCDECDQCDADSVSWTIVPD